MKVKYSNPWKICIMKSHKHFDMQIFKVNIVPEGNDLMKMAVDDDGDVLPDRDAAKGFYAKYEPKEVLGRGGCSVVRRCIGT